MRTDWWFFSGNGTGLTCLGPGLTATAVTGGGRESSTLSTLSTTLPTNAVPGWLPGRRRRTTPLATLADGHYGPRFSASSREQKQGIEGARPTSGHLHSLYLGTQARSQNTWAGAQMQLRGVVGFSCPPRHQPDQPTWAGGPVLLNPVRLLLHTHWVRPVQIPRVRPPIPLPSTVYNAMRR